nr:hypothetical protein [Arthrobacter sp. Y81]
MRLYEILQLLADRARPWEDNGTSARFRKPVQVKTLADLAAIGAELAGPLGQVSYTVNNAPKTLDEIAAMSDVQLNEVMVLAYLGGAPAGGVEHSKATVIINNKGHSSYGLERSYMTITISEPSQFNNLPVTLDQAKSIAERCVTIRGKWSAKDYPVVKTITKATAQQREHDRKLKWQAAGLSLLLSVPIGVLTAVLTVILTPTPGG